MKIRVTDDANVTRDSLQEFGLRCRVLYACIEIATIMTSVCMQLNEIPAELFSSI